MSYRILHSGFSQKDTTMRTRFQIQITQKSTNEYEFTFGGEAVTWKSAKQTIIFKSTIEQEFIALELACNKVEWLKNVLAEILLGTNSTPSVSMHRACEATIATARNKIFSSKNRQNCLRYGAVKHLVKDGIQ